MESQLSVLERESEIVATHVTRDRLFFCRAERKRIWFGTQLIQRPDTLQTFLPEHIRDFDLYNIWRRVPGVYEFGPYRYVITDQRWYAISAPKEGHDYVTALKEKELLKMLFFANCTSTLGY
jgi:hypothetical protein